jgi:WD40 repeat protein
MLLSPDGGTLMTAQLIRKEITVRSVLHPSSLHSLRYTKSHTAMHVEGGELKAIRSDGNLLLTNNAITITLPTGQQTRNELGKARVMAFSPDGRYAAADNGNGSVSLWDGALRRRLGVLTGDFNSRTDDPESVSALAFSHDGHTLAVAFSADDTALFTAGEHMRWQKYVVDPEHLAATICHRAGVPLSRADWKSYLPEVPYHRTCSEHE